MSAGAFAKRWLLSAYGPVSGVLPGDAIKHLMEHREGLRTDQQVTALG